MNRDLKKRNELIIDAALFYSFVVSPLLVFAVIKICGVTLNSVIAGLFYMPTYAVSCFISLNKVSYYPTAAAVNVAIYIVSISTATHVSALATLVFIYIYTPNALESIALSSFAVFGLALVYVKKKYEESL